MKKNTYIFIAVILILATLVSVTPFASNAQSNNDGFELALRMATVIRENSNLVKDNIEVANVSGHSIYNGELELRKKIFDVTREDNEVNNYQAAFNSILEEKKELILADKFGISVTDKELKAELESEFSAIYSAENSEIKLFRQYVDTLGLTEEEYWNNYRPRELNKYLTHLKVSHFLRENKSNRESLEIDYIITNDTIKAKINR